MLPVVMLTAELGAEKTRGLEAGADDFIAKPFDPDELFARVQSLLRIKRYHDELAELNRTLEERVQSQVGRARADATAGALPVAAIGRVDRQLGR